MRGRQLLWAVGLLVLLTQVTQTLVSAEDQSYAYCFNLCSGNSQCRTSSPDDGVCVCDSGLTGKDCSEDAPGISELSTISSTAYVSVANMELDTSQSNIYVSARDATTKEDRVLQFEAASGVYAFSSSQAGVLAADTGYNGTYDHPHSDYDATTSEGYFDTFRKVRLDSKTTATAVYVPVNEWQFGSTTYQFKIYKFAITAGVIATSSSAVYSKTGHYLDAFAVNEATSALVIKTTPDYTGTSTGEMTLLSADLVEQDAGNAVGAVNGDANYYRFEDAAYVATDPQYVVFGGARKDSTVAGTSVAGDGTFDGVYKPVLLRVGATAATFVGVSTDVQAEAFPSLSSSCENTGGAAVNEGQYTTFATVISYNGVVYAGTRGRASHATSRNGCLVSVSASTMDVATMSTIVLDGAAGERDVLAGTVDSSGGFLYFSTSGSPSRVVKIEIATFSKVGAFQSTSQVTGIVNLAARYSVVTATNATTGTTVALATTAEITSLSPSYGPVTGGTTITLTGRGFWETPLATLGTAFTSTIACRIGDPSVGTYTESAATYVSATQILCVSPAASSAGASASGMADVQLSFFGYPANAATAVWSTWSVYFRYYKVPVVYSISPKSVEDSGLSSTDGGTTTSPVLLTLTGGPFFDSGTIKCRIMDNSSSTLATTDASLVSGSSGTQITCYPCATSVVASLTTCASPGIRTGPNPWTMVMVTLNGVDYHNASDALNVFGEPTGVQVVNAGQHFSYAAAATTSIDTLTVMIVDSNGWLSPNYNNLVQMTGTSVASGEAVTLSVTGSSSNSVATSSGYATFSLYFNTAPTVGDYTVTFTALDSAAAALATTANITVTITAGAANALTAIPRTLTVTAARDILLGDILVQMTDTAGNLVGSADSSTRNVTVTSDRTSANGASLTGALSANTTLGEVTFTLGLSSPALGASTSPAASAGSYTLTFATSGLTSVTARVVVLEAAPSYLRISGSTARSKAAQTNTYFDDITVRAYDDGHNPVASTDSQTRSITLTEATGVLDLRGVTQFTMTSGAVTIRSLFAQAALSIYAYEPAVGSYTLSVAADGLTSASLSLNITLNQYGAKMEVASTSAAALLSSASMTFGDVSVRVLDQGRNFMGAADASTAASGELRTIYALSSTLQRTGFGTLTVSGEDLNILATALSYIPAVGQTPAQPTGEANFTGSSAIVASAPSAGTHIVSFTDQSLNLEVASINVTVSVGPATALSIAGSPITSYSPSAGVWAADEAAWYASEEVVPLDSFTVQSVDAGGNVVTTSAPYTISAYTLINTTLGPLVATPHDLAPPSPPVPAGSTAPPPSPAPPPPPTGQFIESNTTFPTETVSTWTHSGGTVVVTQFLNLTTMTVVNATHTTAQNVSTTFNLTETYSTEYSITPSIDFSALGTSYRYTTGLNVVGTYQEMLILNPVTSNSSASLLRTMDSGAGSWTDLALYRPPAGLYTLTFSAADPGIAPATAAISVNLGVATQLGVLAPCTGTQVFAPGVCTQSVFGSAQRTSLNAMQVFLLDGSASPVLGQDFSCLDLLSELPGDRNNPCRRTVSVRVVAGSATLTGTQSLTMVAGRVTFGDLAMIEPSTGSNSLLFESAGVEPVRFDLTVIPGAGYSLQVVPPDGVPAPATSKDSYPSALETVIASPAYPLAVRVLDGGRNPIEVAEGSEYLVYVSCDTADVLVDNNPGVNFTLTAQGVAYFADLKLLSPKAQSHVLRFESSPQTFGTEYEITVVVGPPVALAVTSFAAGDCTNEFGQVDTCKYRAVTETPLGSLEVSVRDAGGNDVGANNVAARRITALVRGPAGWADLLYDNLDPDIGPGEHDEEKTIMLPKTGSATFELLVLLNPPIGTYNITLTSPGMTSTLAEFEITVGVAYTLAVPPVWPGLGGTDLEVVTEYESERSLELETIAVIVLDGGFNFVGENDVDEVGQNFFRTVSITTDKGTLTSGTRKTSAGQVFYNDVRLVAPTAGLYKISFTAPGLEPAVLEVTVVIGYPSQLAVVNLGTRLWTEYESDELVTVNEVQVQVLDAGGSFVGNRWDEERNVTVYLESTVNLDHGGSVYSEDYASPSNGLNETLLIVPQGGDMQVVGGRVAWCDPNLQTMPGYCRDGQFPIQFELPFHGRYTLVFMSICPFSACPSRPGTARYSELFEARLEIDIVPGVPVRLQFTSAPPSVAEHTFDLRPIPALEALDVAGNLCVQRNTFLSASFQPAMKEVYGSVTAMVGGEGQFDHLRFVGVRGQVYTLRFEAPGLDLVVEFFPFEVMSCAEVKPHSRPDGKGGCECVPGYTEDVHVTGFAADRLELPSTASFPDMYRQVVHNEGNWLDILQPYGVCVPCRNGFYKAEGGAQNCTACPAFMDTSRKAGAPAPPWMTESGEVLDGSLAQFNQSACHCIVEEEPPFRSYFRNATEAYKCEPCPAGASCNGLDHRELAAQPGRWRSSRESLVFWECPNPGSCLGGVDSWCSSYNGSGAAGVLCAECDSGWAHPTVNGRFPPSCSKCIPRAAAGLVVLFQWAASIFAAYVVLRVNFRRNSDSVMFFKTLLSHMQTVSIARDIDLNWPDGVATYFSLTEKISTVSLQSKEADCAFGMNHYNYTGYYVALPVLLFVGAVGYAVAMFVLERKQRSKEAYRLKHQAQEEQAARRRRGDEGGKAKGMLKRVLKSDKDRGSADAGTEGEATYVDRAIAVAVIGFCFCYTTILKYLMGLIRCTDLSDSHRDHPVGDSYLVADLGIQCGTPTHAAWLFALLVFLGTYAVGVPIVWAVVLYNSEPADPGTRYRFGFLYKGQSSEARFWEFFVLARKTVMVSVAVLIHDNPRLAGYVCLWVVQVSVVLHLWCDPMESERQSRLELLSLLVLMITYNVGILYAGDVPYHTRNFLGFVVYVVNLSVYAVFAQALWSELRQESKVAMVKRAKADFRVEDEIRKKQIGHDLGRLPTRHLHPRAAAALKTSFADDTLRDDIAAAETSDLRMRHLALSVHLENMRNAWRKSKTKGKVMHKQMALEDLARQRRREQVPVERWRMRRAEDAQAKEAARRGEGRRPPKPPKGSKRGAGGAASAADDPGERRLNALHIDDSDDEPEPVPRWKQRMADKDWRTKERLKYRLAERFGEEDNGGGGMGDGGSARTSDTAGGDTSYRSRTSYSRTTGGGRAVSTDYDDGGTERSRTSEDRSEYTREDRSEYTRADDATSMARSDDEGYTERSGGSRARSMLSP